jgi:HSP20 family protein
MALTTTRNSDLALLDQMFDSFFDWHPARVAYPSAPLDLYEKDGKYVLEIAAPGYDAKDINVEVSGGTVTVSGERTEESDKQDARYHRREIRRGSFTRRVTLPQDLDTNSVTATVSNGILKVELSPLTPIAPKKVEVKPT